MVDVSVPAPEKPGMYFSGMVILYGVKLNLNQSFGEFDAGETGNAALQMQLYRGGKKQENDEYSIVLAYGYSFEGHCYRLDTNRVFIVKGPKSEDAAGCGFDDLATAARGKYQMWRVRSNEELLEIVLNYGDVKKLILDANLPGRRSPSSYAITASLAHRDGRLNRE
ncbi:hypothetical protein [Rhizobium leguminosarum]|uniref:hypothetical protein n=1 Tax=Rhizobium leguminosarum TaxID=384 RepID=UPI003F94E191